MSIEVSVSISIGSIDAVQVGNRESEVLFELDRRRVDAADEERRSNRSLQIDDRDTHWDG